MTEKYSKTAIILHWGMALFIFYALFSGLFKGFIPKGDLKTLLMDWHKWLGLTVFWLVFVRLGWRITHPAPAIPNPNSVQSKLAHMAHIFLYALMAAIPLAGYLLINSKGYPVNYFGLSLPDILPKDDAVSHFLKNIHVYMAYVLGLVLLAHVLAALKHQIIDKDHLMDRMRLK